MSCSVKTRFNACENDENVRITCTVCDFTMCQDCETKYYCSICKGTLVCRCLDTIRQRCKISCFRILDCGHMNTPDVRDSAMTTACEECRITWCWGCHDYWFFPYCEDCSRNH